MILEDLLKDVKQNELISDDFNVYKSVKAVNASMLKAIKKSPLTALTKVAIKETEAMRFGSLYHKYVLEPETFDSEYFVFDESQRPDTTKTMAATVNKQWKNEMLNRETRILINETDLKTVEAMREQLFENNPMVEEMIEAAQREVSLYTTIEINGDKLPVKCRFDAINVEQGYILDLKTASDASPDGFGREAGKFAYHIQCAFYRYVAESVFKRPFKFFFAVQEKTHPFNNCNFFADSETIISGENELLTLLPAALRLAHKPKAFSYEVFTAHAAGVHSLKIPSFYTKPREFYFYD